MKIKEDSFKKVELNAIHEKVFMSPIDEWD
jgi:hypothetical protein